MSGSSERAGFIDAPLIGLANAAAMAPANWADQYGRTQPRGKTWRQAKPKVTAGLMCSPDSGAPSVDHGHDRGARRDHRGSTADQTAAGVVIDHPSPGRYGHEHECADELDDHSDPQRPFPEVVLLELQQVAMPQRGSMIAVLLTGAGFSRRLDP